MPGITDVPIILVIACVTGISSSPSRLKTINVQTQFPRWPNPSAIPYYIDPAYTPVEQALIKAAMQKVSDDMSGCVGFTPVAPTSTDFKVKITPVQIDGTTPEQFCYSYPGMYKEGTKTEQRLVLSRGTTGCFDGNVRSLMKYFAVLLGKRNEHQRADRDLFITVDNAAVQANELSKSAYRLYTATEAYSGAFPYDYCSITHNKPTEFASPGGKSFTVNKAPFFIPALPRLSNTDCQLISLMYRCDRTKCAPLDCAGLPAPKPSVNGTLPTGGAPLSCTIPNQKQKVLQLLKAFETRDVQPFAYVNPNKYIQHNLDAADGIGNVQASVASLTDAVRVNTVRIFQDGDYVWAHTEYQFGIDIVIAIDMFRFENGLIVEHWDNIQSTAGPNPSGHTMIDGPTLALDWQLTEQNKALVKEFYQTVLVNGDVSQMARFYAGDALIQHNPSVADGLSGLQNGMAAFVAAGTPIRIAAIHQVLGEGSFVLVTADGTFGSEPTAFYDLFRVEKGKIAEHWDVLQAIPPQSQWKNQNGKF